MSSTGLLLLNLILALMMFGIALSLRAADFRQVLRQPKAPLVAMLAQFVLLPAASWLLTMLVPMPAEVALGVILIGACPGGSFSNIMTYLSKGNVALSVSMTGIASLAAALLTPFNFMLYASLNPATKELLTSINVPFENILILVILVLALPLLLGMLTAKLAPNFALKSQGVFRIISLTTLFSFVLLALIKNWQTFADAADWFLLLVLLHNGFALSLGYGLAYLMQLSRADRRAITFETGIQNSGLGLGIIFTFFSEFSGMAIIAAAWGIWHLISGLSLTWLWHWRDKTDSQESQQ